MEIPQRGDEIFIFPRAPVLILALAAAAKNCYLDDALAPESFTRDNVNA